MTRPRYRNNLPQLQREMFLTDSGMETDFVFNRGLELPEFASFTLLKEANGCAELLQYCLAHAEIAREHDCGFIFESPTWRASPDWGDRLGYSRNELEKANRDAIALIEAAREKADLEKPFVISANTGPRGDGYDPGVIMSASEAEAYHGWQVEVFADTAADLVTAMTITNVDEAIGITNAAAQADIPCVISFTVETDGRLPTGQPIGEAMMQTDFEARRPPVYYMINCAHPTHFMGALQEGGPWLSRLRGIRANASKCSHAELDECDTLDDGNPVELGADYVELRRLVPSLHIFGGCCGTDARHVAAIAKAVDAGRASISSAA